MMYTPKFTTFAGIIAVVLAVAIAALGGSQTARAWCDENAGFSDRCVAENYESIPDKRGVSFEQYKEMAQKCKSGNPSGLDFGSVDEGSCLNAASSCIQKSVDLNECNGDSMATMAMNGSCNHGKLFSSNTSSCTRLKEMNEAAFNKAKEAAEKTAESSCSVQGSETEKYDQKQKCKEAISKAGCKTPSYSGSDNKRFNEYGFSEYQSCINKALKESAKNESECKGRQGIWDKSQNKCKQNYSDIKNKDACTGAGGKWDDAKSSCGPQDGKNQDGSDTSTPGSTGGTGTKDRKKTAGEAGTCGGARTNLIVCDDKAGLGALGAILRIALFVLTMIVGIASVGGIAYAAVLYAGAQDNAGNTQKAKEMIRNIVIGLVAYGLMIAIIGWLVPGSVIK